MYLRKYLLLLFTTSMVLAQPELDHAVFMDGNGDFVKLLKPVISSNSFTIECWAYMRGAGGGGWKQNTLFEQRSNRDAPKYSSIVFWAENQDAEISAGLMSAGGQWESFKYPRANYGEWHHYAMILDQYQVSVYLDGNFVTGGTINRGTDFFSDIDFIDIGHHRYDSYDWGFFNGMIDEFRIWNKALSLETVLSVMNDTLPPVYYSSPDSGLVGYWRFDEALPINGTDNNLTFLIPDLSGHNNGFLVDDAVLIPKSTFVNENIIRLGRKQLDSSFVFVPLIIDINSENELTSLSMSITGFEDNAAFELFIPNNKVINFEKSIISSQSKGDSLIINIASSAPIQKSGILGWLKLNVLNNQSHIPLYLISAEIGGIAEPPTLIDGGLYIPTMHIGDVNRDNVIDEKDVYTVLEIVLGKQEPPTDAFYFADVSLDGKVSALDASILLQYYYNIIDILPISDSPSSYAFSGNILLGKPIWQTDNTVAMPVLFEQVENLYAISGELKFDSEMLQFGGFQANYSFNAIDFVVEENGSVKFVMANSLPISGTDILGCFRFNANRQVDSLITDFTAIINEGQISTDVRQTRDINPQPFVFELGQNYPNPFNPVTTIPFSVQNPGEVELSVYNIHGQLIKTLVNKTFTPGHYQVDWHGMDRADNPVSSGVYLYVFSIDNRILDKKRMLLLK